MSWFSKVVWSEGLFLRPQHFQQQDRHAEWQLEARTRSLAPHQYGFSTLELDETALMIGKIAIKGAAGILPDGTPFEFPAAHGAPAAFDFPADSRDALVCLSLPLRRPFATEVNDASGTDPLARYAIGEDNLPDATCQSAASEALQTGQPRLVLELESKLSDAYVKIGVIRITERKPDNSLLVDRGYIPPTLACAADKQLTTVLREILGLLRQRGEALAGRMTQAGHGGVSEIADFLFLLTVNRQQPVFEHLSGLNPLHPERLYAQMLTLMGELATLVGDKRRPAELPPYQHDNLQLSFDALMREIRRGLSAILEQNAVQIELVDHQQGRYVGNIADRGLLRQAGFVLAVNAQMPSEAVRSRFPTQAKLGPVEKIRELVNLQLPGIALRPLPVAPRQIPFHAGFSYFELETTGDLWKQLDASGGLGMYVSGDFPGLEVSLWAIKA
ncbi:type VI secretion system baseplate subunit TssK [Uliginosibacterium flavum]|uniref:Type VI secretion system baseplate subunit TssK n=1 Tax=Uliginosibacterium flavum TaxID=1396831 RepID=A0ABV2TF81_9RHOO